MAIFTSDLLCRIGSIGGNCHVFFKTVEHHHLLGIHSKSNQFLCPCAFVLLYFFHCAGLREYWFTLPGFKSHSSLCSYVKKAGKVGNTEWEIATHRFIYYISMRRIHKDIFKCCGSSSVNPFWTDIQQTKEISVGFEVTALLQASITETWPKNSRDEDIESYFPAAHRDSDLTFATVVSRAQRVSCHLFFSWIWQSQLL